MVVIANGE